ncbi:MAG: hypothetical protein V9G12_21390 [Microthrixaceae bacterium]
MVATFTPVTPWAAERADHGPTGADRVDAAGIGDQLRSPPEDVADRRGDVEGEVAGVAEQLVALAILLQDRQRQLGEGLAHQVVDAVGQQRRDGEVPVTVEALSPTDPYRHRPSTPSSRAHNFLTGRADN